MICTARHHTLNVIRSIELSIKIHTIGQDGPLYILRSTVYNFQTILFFSLKDIYLLKALTCMIFSCINKKCFFIKETDTFGHIVVWTIYTSHIEHFTPQHTAFEQSAACLSVY